MSVIVQASDLDLDPVSYNIMSGDNNNNFVIDSRTGVVRLIKHRQPNLVGPLYVLNISASDGLHVSQSVLLVSIQDINNHKPVFKDCDKYRPVIAEDIAIGSSVIQVCDIFFLPTNLFEALVLIIIRVSWNLPSVGFLREEKNHSTGKSLETKVQ